MTNTLELKAMMIRRQITAEELADRIGISQQSLSYKINNKREFTSSEIKSISDVLAMTLEERDMIFFGDVVENNSTR